MRFNETCVLIATVYAPDDEGVPQPTQEKSTVFCNPQHMGAITWSSMYEIGISVDARVQIRTCDYAGQRDVFYREKYFSVETVEEKGDFTVLSLRHQKSDSAEPDPEPEPEPGPDGDADGQGGA